MFEKIKSYLKNEPVLTVAVFLAIISMFFVTPSKKYLSYIDFKTLACLFCLMTSAAGLKQEGVLERISFMILSRIKNLRGLTLFLVFSCYFFAMIVTNDVSLITIVPITLAILSDCGFEKRSAFIIVLQTIAANIGSALTPIGNPQNLYLFSHYNMLLSDFFITMLPIVFIGGLLLFACCMVVPVSKLEQPTKNVTKLLRKKQVVIYCILFLLSVIAVFKLISFWAVAAIIFATVAVMDFRTVMSVDYSLLLTFAAIFIFVGNMGHIGHIYLFLSSFSQKNTFIAAILTSQIISNVPAAILLSGFTNNTEGLLAGTNIGGLGTLVASMASVISYKIYSGVHTEKAAGYIKLFTILNVLFLLVLTVFFIFIKSI